MSVDCDVWWPALIFSSAHEILDSVPAIHTFSLFAQHISKLGSKSLLKIAEIKPILSHAVILPRILSRIHWKTYLYLGVYTFVRTCKFVCEFFEWGSCVSEWIQNCLSCRLPDSLCFSLYLSLSQPLCLSLNICCLYLTFSIELKHSTIHDSVYWWNQKYMIIEMRLNYNFDLWMHMCGLSSCCSCVVQTALSDLLWQYYFHT